jgi:hypothetical protein
MADNRELPLPGSPELLALVQGEMAEIYAFLYNRRNDPPTMVEIEEHITQIYGAAHAQTGRRLRRGGGLRDHFDIPRPTPGADGRFRFRLVGWRQGPKVTRRRGLSPRIEAEVYSNYRQCCAMCGRSPNHDGVRLVIDHKLPVAWGGTSEVDNLQPLCEEHNRGKQAFFSSFDEYAPAIRAATVNADIYVRIGELLKALAGKPVPVELVEVIAGETNRGDPTKRLRELRPLGWRIRVVKKKQGRRTRSYYILEHWEPWPKEGPAAVIQALERDRRRRKQLESMDARGVTEGS